MGLLVEVYRHPFGGDFTINGISNGRKFLCLINVDGPCAPDAETPAAVLIKKPHVGNVVIVPAEADGSPSKRLGMFGGNFAYTSDSRFSEKLRELSGYQFSFPVAIHDRYER